MKRKRLIVGACILMPVLLLAQPQWVFNDMDEDPYWGDQVDRLADPDQENNVYRTYVSFPVMFGDGSMQVDWGVTQTQETGSSSYLTHIHLDTTGTYNWTEYDSLVFWYYIETSSTMPGAVQMRFNLGDVSDSQNSGTKRFANMENWISTHDILDTEVEWTKLAIPLTDAGNDPGGNGFELTDARGIPGNGQLDLDMIRGFQFEFMIDANMGDVATGRILIDHIILTTTAGDTAVITDLDEDPYWNGQQDQYDDPETNIYLSYVSDPVFNGQAAMWLDWGVTHDQDWGGGSYLNHVHYDSLEAYDWSAYDSVAFWYYNDVPSSIPGAVHVRFNLGEVSDTVMNVTSFGDMEYWYSFLYILDEDPGWNKVALPLMDVREDPNGNGFERTGWYGIDGNDQLDLDVIKGFQFEFSMEGTQEGDVALGTIIFDELVLFSGEYSDVERIPLQAPARFQLSQNYPNPFNGRTAIDYSLAHPQNVLLKLFDVTGREVGTLVNGRMPAGAHTVYLDASDYPSGVYLYKLMIGNESRVQRMILTK